MLASTAAGVMPTQIFFWEIQYHLHLGDHLVEDLNVVVGQVEENQATEAAESPLLHRADVTALQRQVSQVGRVFESPSWKFLDIVASEI